MREFRVEINSSKQAPIKISSRSELDSIIDRFPTFLDKKHIKTAVSTNNPKDSVLIAEIEIERTVVCPDFNQEPVLKMYMNKQQE